MNLKEIKNLCNKKVSVENIAYYIESRRKDTLNYSKMSSSEVECLCQLLEFIQIDLYDNIDLNVEIIAGEYEFDFVKTDGKNIVILDFKSCLNSKEKILAQMKRFYAILEVNGYEKICIYVYVLGNKIFKYTKEDYINNKQDYNNSSVKELDSTIKSMNKSVDLNVKFVAVDVYGRTENQKIVLSSQQKKILKNTISTKKAHVIFGEPGSGKSTLFAKIACENECILAFPFKKRIWGKSGILTNYDEDSYGFYASLHEKIMQGKYAGKIILIDEAQRIGQKKFNELVKLGVHIIFFMDPNQRFDEEKINVKKNSKNYKIHELKTSFRIEKKKLEMLKILCKKEKNTKYTVDDFKNSFVNTIDYNEYKGEILAVKEHTHVEYEINSAINNISREFENATIILNMDECRMNKEEFLDNFLPRLYICCTRAINIEFRHESMCSYKNFNDLIESVFYKKPNSKFSDLNDVYDYLLDIIKAVHMKDNKKHLKLINNVKVTEMETKISKYAEEKTNLAFKVASFMQKEEDEILNLYSYLYLLACLLEDISNKEIKVEVLRDQYLNNWCEKENLEKWKNAESKIYEKIKIMKNEKYKKL